VLLLTGAETCLYLKPAAQLTQRASRNRSPPNQPFSFLSPHSLTCGTHPSASPSLLPSHLFSFPSHRAVPHCAEPARARWDGQAAGWHACRARARPCARLGVSPGGKDPSTLSPPRLKRWLQSLRRCHVGAPTAPANQGAPCPCPCAALTAPTTQG
jgi:hypothetical protein